MSNKNVELASSGLKCDNPNCDWKDERIPVEIWQEWINAKCPKCGENVLTLEDYTNAMACVQAAELLNMFSLDELKEMSGNKDIKELMELPMFKDAKGLEHLTGDPDKKVLMSFDTHKEIKVKELKPCE